MGATEAVIAVVVALITAGIPAVVALRRWRSENAEQHGRSMAVLERIDVKIDKIDDRLDQHIDWHAHGGPRNEA